MAADHELSKRPALGFVVEGSGEYYCYPSIVARLLGLGGVRWHRVNANGCGAILSRLDEQLTDLVMASHPVGVVVTIDLADALRSGRFVDCASLLTHLRESVKRWRRSAEHDGRLQPLPESVSIVLQVQKFETWFLADVESLVEKVPDRVRDIGLSDVDSVKEDPVKVLRHCFGEGVDLKQPRIARKLVSKLNLDTVRSRSRSFDKFAREVLRLYGQWEDVCRV